MAVKPLTSMPAAGALAGPELFYAQQTSTDVKVTATQMLAATGVINVKMAGAFGDGTTDDLPALNSVVSTVLAGTNGGTIFFPPGYYRITGQWAIGQQTYDTFEFIVNRTAVIADYTPHNVASAVTANKAHRGQAISIEFAAGAYIVADFTPTVLTPAVGYYFDTYTGNPSITGLSVLTPSMLTSGRYDENQTATANKIIGLFFIGNPRLVHGTLMAGVQHGIVTANAFWTSIRNLYATQVLGDALNIAGGNAITVNQIAAISCGRGLVFDGDSSQLTGIHTEITAQDVVVFAANCCVIGPGYLEDTSATDGTGLYSITLGTTQNGSDVNSTTLVGLRPTALRPNKNSIRVWGCRNLEMKGVRTFNKAPTIDTASYGICSDTDFNSATQQGNFITQGNGFTIMRVNAPFNDFVAYGPWIFDLGAITPGSIASLGNYNFNYTMPFTLTANTFATSLTYTAGGPGNLVTQINVASGTQVKIAFNNPTAAAINPGTFHANLLLFVGQ